jgi:hypothetical protein
MDPSRSREPGHEGAGRRVVGERSATPAAVRAEYPAPTPRVPYRPVMCVQCDAVVSLTDTECWNCYRYFGATEFDEQR